MGVYIKGLELPGNCAECPVNMEVCKHGYEYLLEHPELYGKRADDCPIAEVKAPHGRLIDENAVMRDFAQRDNFSEKTLMDFLLEAPTVIEAEGKDNG